MILKQTQCANVLHSYLNRKAGLGPMHQEVFVICAIWKQLLCVRLTAVTTLQRTCMDILREYRIYSHFVDRLNKCIDILCTADSTPSRCPLPYNGIHIVGQHSLHTANKMAGKVVINLCGSLYNGRQ